MNFAKDNYYKECPAVMNYSQLTDYRQASVREQYIRNLNNIPSEHEYRSFLQAQGSNIMNAEWSILSSSYNCRPNVCIHNSPLNQTQAQQFAENKLYNDVRMGRVDQSVAKCPALEDYRLCKN
jgi:hypothetical protein